MSKIDKYIKFNIFFKVEILMDIINQIVGANYIAYVMKHSPQTFIKMLELNKNYWPLVFYATGKDLLLLQTYCMYRDRYYPTRIMHDIYNLSPSIKHLDYDQDIRHLIPRYLNHIIHDFLILNDYSQTVGASSILEPFQRPIFKTLTCDIPAEKYMVIFKDLCNLFDMSAICFILRYSIMYRCIVNNYTKLLRYFYRRLIFDMDLALIENYIIGRDYVDTYSGLHDLFFEYPLFDYLIENNSWNIFYYSITNQRCVQYEFNNKNPDRHKTINNKVHYYLYFKDVFAIYCKNRKLYNYLITNKFKTPYIEFYVGKPRNMFTSDFEALNIFNAWQIITDMRNVYGYNDQRFILEHPNTIYYQEFLDSLTLGVDKLDIN